MEATLVSTVTPVYRGAESLRELVDRISAVRESWQRDGLPLVLIESIFVDDGSVDGSADVLEELAREHDWVQAVTLSRNFGQHPATVAGILHASGDWVATLDEDLQHQPEHLLQLLREAVLAKHDLVYARPIEPVHRSLFRDGSSRLLKRFLAAATRNPHVRSFNSYRMIRGSIARAAAAVSSHETYLDIILWWFTGRIGSVLLPLEDRRFQATGRSGYTARALLSHARRLLLSSRTSWLRVGGVLGFGLLVFSALLALITFVQKLSEPDSVPVRGWTSLFLAILFFGGLTAFLLGALFEYLSVLILKSHGKPTLFVVDRSKDAVLRHHFEREHGAPAEAKIGGR